MPKCKICGYEAKSLQPHLKYKHDLTVYQYYKMFNGGPELVYDYNCATYLKHWQEEHPEEAYEARVKGSRKAIKAAQKWQKDHPEEVLKMCSHNGKITGAKVNNIQVWREKVGSEEVSRVSALGGKASAVSKGHEFMARKALENNRYCKYEYHSEKFDISRNFASRWEVNFIKLCESCDFVKTLVHEPFGVPYYDNKNKMHKYYPDFLLNNKWLIEIKPYGKLKNQDVILKASVAIDYCKEIRYEYIIITEHELPSLRDGKIATSAQQELKLLLMI